MPLYIVKEGFRTLLEWAKMRHEENVGWWVMSKYIVYWRWCSWTNKLNICVDIAEQSLLPLDPRATSATIIDLVLRNDNKIYLQWMDDWWIILMFALHCIYRETKKEEQQPWIHRPALRFISSGLWSRLSAVQILGSSSAGENLALSFKLKHCIISKMYRYYLAFNHYMIWCLLVQTAKPLNITYVH